jgi:hypothetical protein
MNLFGSSPLFLSTVPILSGLDFILLPIFIAIFTGFFILIRNSRYKNDVTARYFIPALIFRFGGAFLTALMYQYYYGYGDTFYYYQGVFDIFNAFITNPATGIELIVFPYDLYSEEAQNALTYHLLFRQASSAAVMRIGGFFSIFTFGSYLGASLGITSIAFIGCWMLYRVFQDIYPHLHFPLAIAILFVPSLCFWGTGVMKDPLSLGGLGMFVYGLYFIFYKRTRGLVIPSIALVFGFYLAITVKIYIALALMPAALVWIVFLYKEKIRNKTLRMLSGPFLLVFGAAFGLLALQQLGSVSEKFAIENMVVEAAKTQWWLSLSTERDGGTGYSLGTIEPSLTGVLKVFPASVNVSLFRPYIWEARKVIVLPSAAEALFSFLFTLYVFFKVGIIRTLREMFSNPTVLFCLIFAIIFAFAVGFTSMNFGALARYKIPALPFYFSALIILLDSKNAIPISSSPNTQRQRSPKNRNPSELPLQ